MDEWSLSYVGLLSLAVQKEKITYTETITMSYLVPTYDHNRNTHTQQLYVEVLNEIHNRNTHIVLVSIYSRWVRARGFGWVRARGFGWVRARGFGWVRARGFVNAL